MPHDRRKLASNGATAFLLVVAILTLTGAADGQCVVGTNAALAFDGVNDYALVGDNAALEGFADFTIECWLATSSLQQQQVIAKHVSGSCTATAFVVGVGNGTVSYAVCTPGGFHQAISSTFISDSNWHHVSLSRQGCQLTLRINGMTDTSSNHCGALSVGNALFQLGAGQLSSGQPYAFFDGLLDEVRIWNVARSQAQIQSTMNVGLTGNEPGLVGYWRFDEGSGQTVFNSAVATGSALDGTLGSNALPGTDDPTWISTGLPPLPYCPPCPTPPCGQVNSPCATLTVNGIGAASQGPFNVVVAPAGTLSLNWSGPANQPYVLVATPGLVPGQLVFPPSFVVDIDIGSYFLVYSGFDPVFGPLYFTNAAGTSGQTWTHPGAPLGVTMNVQGLMYDLAFTCGSGLPFMTTASFAIQL